MRLAGKIALVTGGGKNIGQGIALALAREGARVAVAGRGTEALERTAAALREAGGTALLAPCDVRDERQVEALFERVTREWGLLDILVNNAGVEYTKPLAATSADEWDDLFAVNTRGVFLGCRHAIGRFGPGGGAIVNVASAAGRVAMPLGAVYGASKAAVIQMSAALALELRPRRIRVNCVCPGFIATDMAARGLEAAKELGLPVQALVAYRQGRIGEVSEVAEVVAFLASDAASFVNGQAVFVDGGASVC